MLINHSKMRQTAENQNRNARHALEESASPMTAQFQLGYLRSHTRASRGRHHVHQIW